MFYIIIMGIPEKEIRENEAESIERNTDQEFPKTSEK